MEKYFRIKLKNIIVSLRLSILTIFVTLFVIGVASLIAISYIRSSSSMSYTALLLMNQFSSHIYHDIVDDKMKPIEFETKFSSELIEHGVVDYKNFNAWVVYTRDLLKRIPILQAAYWGDNAGNFIVARDEADGSITTEIIDRKSFPPKHTYIYRDLSGNTIKTLVSNDFSYDPRVRPWYTKAKDKKTFIWTDIYVYQSNKLLGITAASPVIKDNKFLGVFGLDLSLVYLSSSIKNEKISENGLVYIVTGEGKLVAFPDRFHAMGDLHGFSKPWLSKSFDLYKKTGARQFSFKMEGKKYLAIYKPLTIAGFDGVPWLVGIVAPENDFINELKQTHLITTLVSLLVLICGIVLMSHLATRVSNPLKRLVNETEKIKKFDLSNAPPIQSRIKEVLYLSHAIHSMKRGLQSFQRYVPSVLVRQLIETGNDAIIGGNKKNLAVMFTDINNFTSIAEKENPDQVMSHLCEYLNELSHIILEEQGTIDKYIGDSIMAFWGAPLDEVNPCHLAARAAVRCIKCVDELNAKWQQEDKPQYPTRMGIHWGEAIVGNLGSSERLNYTAIGDAINLANRLEAINKVYGTKIIVSDTFYKEIQHDFVFRKVDYIIVKGRTRASFIYELLAENKKDLLFDIDSYHSAFDRGFSAYKDQKWEDAIAHFKECLNIYPKDTVARVFIIRCETFVVFPPGSMWEGIWNFEDK